jgi:exodeoxyribonuclease VII large subunit
MFMDLPDDTRAGLLADVPPGDNSPPLSVSELSGALKRSIESELGGSGPGRDLGIQAPRVGALLFTLRTIPPASTR